jgi:hypothetical protein
MIFRSLGIAALVVSALALGGCSTVTNPGAPDQSFEIEEDLQELEAEFKTKGSVVSFFDIKEADRTPDDRNRFISYRLTLMNIQYIKFIRRFAVEKAQLDTAADILIIGVNLAGTLVGAASTKGILAAISGGTAASRTSISKNFFHEKTVPVLVTAMNAERKQALIPIIEGTVKSLDEYPLTNAISELLIYYQAGTFIGALQAIQKDAGAKEKQADEIIATFGVDENTNKLVKWIGWDPVAKKFASPDNVTTLLDWLSDPAKGNLPGVAIPTFLYGREYAEPRRKAVADLIQ